jgi:hypothetical protein
MKMILGNMVLTKRVLMKVIIYNVYPHKIHEISDSEHKNDGYPCAEGQAVTGLGGVTTFLRSDIRTFAGS